jgi:hypothetical protein
MSKEKLSASEQCKDMLRTQLIAVSDELEETKKQMNSKLVSESEKEANEAVTFFFK